MPSTRTARISAEPIRTGRSIRSRERGPAGAHEHADRDRDEDDREHLDDLAERQRHVVAAVVVADRQAGDQRQGEQRDHRVDRRQADVQRDVAAEEVAEQVRAGAARRGGEQQHADPEQRRQVEQHHEPEADRGQQDQLARQGTATARGCLPTRRKSSRVRSSPRPNMMIASAIGSPTVVSAESMTRTRSVQTMGRCARRESNSHWPGPKPGASACWATGARRPV